MVGNPRDKSSDLPNVVREGIEPEILRLPDWTRWLRGKDFEKPFDGVPLPGPSTPRSPPRSPSRRPSWFEDPSKPGVPPSLDYAPPGNDGPGFPPTPAPVPEPSPIPESQIRNWLFDYLLGNNLLDQRRVQHTLPSVLRRAASGNEVDSNMRLVASQQTGQGRPIRAPQTVSAEEPSKPQMRFLISRVGER